MEACPCGSQLPLEECCKPIIDGVREPETAEATMRSRYTAYVLGNVDYIMASNHPETSHDVDRGEIEQWSSGSEWLGLTIKDTEAGGPGDDEGWVQFRVRYRMAGQLVVHRERALFRRDESGTWKFHTAEQDAEDVPELVPVGASPKVGRNEPCPCGSGSKYKKCCGAA